MIFKRLNFPISTAGSMVRKWKLDFDTQTLPNSGPSSRQRNMQRNMIRN